MRLVTSKCNIVVVQQVTLLEQLYYLLLQRSTIHCTVPLTTMELTVLLYPRSLDVVAISCILDLSHSSKPDHQPKF